MVSRRATFPRIPSLDEPADPRRSLDRRQVVAAALALLDEVGLDGLTMRRLADQLGVKAASLYWHVRDKGELLGLLGEAICAGIPTPDPALPWRARLETLAHEYRRALLAHRDAARVLAGTLPLGPTRLRLVERSFAAALAAGFTGREASYAGWLVNDYVTSAVLEETGQSPAIGEADAAAAADLAGYFASLPRETYPSINALAATILDADADERFAFGLDAILTGLEQRLTRGAGRSS